MIIDEITYQSFHFFSQLVLSKLYQRVDMYHRPTIFRMRNFQRAAADVGPCLYQPQLTGQLFQALRNR